MGGEVGVMTTGVALFNAFDAGGRDAGAWEVQDGCDGHPQISHEYHYHTLSKCISDTSVSTVIGFALDGFPDHGPEGRHRQHPHDQGPRRVPRDHERGQLDGKSGHHLPLRDDAGLPVLRQLLPRHRHPRPRHPLTRAPARTGRTGANATRTAGSSRRLEVESGEVVADDDRSGEVGGGA